MSNDNDNFCPECGFYLVHETSKDGIYEGVFCYECGYADIDVVSQSERSLRESYQFDLSSEQLL